MLWIDMKILEIGQRQTMTMLKSPIPGTKIRMEGISMKRINKEESRANTVYKYSINSESIYDFLFRVSKCRGIHVRNIFLDNRLDKSDEEYSSVTLGSIVSPPSLKEECFKNGIDTVSIQGTYNEKPITIGAKTDSDIISVITRKSNPVDIESFESETMGL